MDLHCYTENTVEDTRRWRYVKTACAKKKAF